MDQEVENPGYSVQDSFEASIPPDIDRIEETVG